MLKKISVSVLALTVAGFASSAMAACPTNHQITNESYCVDVNIKVLESVSVWAGHADVELIMDGYDGDNTAVFGSSISHINNVDANIKASVSGTLPPPSVPGGGIFFTILPGVDGPTALASPPGYVVPGGFTWSVNGHGGTNTVGGPAVTIIPTTGIDNSIETRDLSYMARSPGENPSVNLTGYPLEVLYTIAANP